MRTTVDPESAELPHLQLARIWREQIASGQLRRRLPPTGELGRLYGASHMTVQRALRLLVDEGYIRTVPGWGRFVNAAEDEPE